jgi:Flp pilus assembly protein TadD, contains TPR repeats
MDNNELFEKGMRFRELHRFKSAATVFRELRTKDPQFSEGWFWEAVSLDNSGDEINAIPCYKESIRLGLSDDLLIRAFLWLSSSLSKTGDADDAEKYLILAVNHSRFKEHDEFKFLSQKIERRIEKQRKNKSR